jgi:hypothetical protein
MVFELTISKWQSGDLIAFNQLLHEASNTYLHVCNLCLHVLFQYIEVGWNKELRAD